MDARAEAREIRQPDSGVEFIYVDETTGETSVAVSDYCISTNPLSVLNRSYWDEDIAAVAFYIRQAWGNEAAPVDPSLVAEVRTQFQVSPPPEATPVSTEISGSLAPSDAIAPPSGPEGSPEVPGGAESGGITPIPTIGQ